MVGTSSCASCGTAVSLPEGHAGGPLRCEPCGTRVNRIVAVLAERYDAAVEKASGRGGGRRADLDEIRLPFQPYESRHIAAWLIMCIGLAIGILAAEEKANWWWLPGISGAIAGLILARPLPRWMPFAAAIWGGGAMLALPIAAAFFGEVHSAEDSRSMSKAMMATAMAAGILPGWLVYNGLLTALNTGGKERGMSHAAWLYDMTSRFQQDPMRRVAIGPTNMENAQKGVAAGLFVLENGNQLRLADDILAAGDRGD